MTLIDDLCDGCGSRFDPMGDPVLTKHPEIGPYAVYCATCEHKAKMTDATEFDVAAVRRDAQVVREHIPSGYRVAHRVADAVPLLLDEITRLLAALDEARAEVGELRLSRAELADECESLRSWVADGKAREMERIADAVARVTPCSCSAQRARAEAAESALAAVRALADSEDAQAVLFGVTGTHPETYGGVTKDEALECAGEVLTRIRAALATPTTPENGDPA